MNVHVTDHVRYRSETHGGVLILDISAGEWVVLNGTAGQFWRSWESGAGFDQAVRQVAEQHPGVPEACIRSDGEHLLRQLLDRRYVESADSETVSPARGFTGRLAGEPQQVPARTVGAAMAAPAASPPQAPLAWLRSLPALVVLVAADVMLRCSFRGSCALVRLSRKSWCRADLPSSRAERGVEAVRRAARWYPGRAACLERSLAAVLLAAVARRRLDWCLGSVPDPYRFHSFVAVAGRPVAASDDDPRLDQYDIMLTL